MKGNAEAIYSALSSHGWSFMAVVAALGNGTHESGGLNPGQCEQGRGTPYPGTVKYGGGLGLWQWTDYPYSYTATYNHPLLWNADRLHEPWYSGNFQCELLNLCTDPTAINTDPAAGGSTWGWVNMAQYGYPGMEFTQFKVASGTRENVDYYTRVFYHCFESKGGDDGSLSSRIQWALYWWDYLMGTSPDPPTPDPPSPDPDPPIPVVKSNRSNWIYYLPHPNFRS